MSTPLLDRPLRQVSDFADFSKPWFLVAAALALFGGPRAPRRSDRDRRDRSHSLLVNQLMKLIGERSRPDRSSWASPRVAGC